MNKHLSAATKNYFICGILMLIAGIGLLLMDKINLGAGCVFFGVVFVVGGIYLIKSGQGFVYTYDEDKIEKKQKANKKSEAEAKEEETKETAKEEE